MANIFSTPLRIGAAVLVVLGIVAAAVVVLVGPEDGRWGIQGALGASPERSASPSSAGNSPTAAAEPSPSPSESMSLKEKNIADAKASLVEYYATTAEVANDGYNNWERKLTRFWGKPTLRISKGQVYDGAEAAGIYTEGAARVVSMVAKSYTADDTGAKHEEVVLEACIDFSEVKTFDGNGKLVPRDASIPFGYTFIYELRNQGDDGKWVLLGESPDRERQC